MIPNTHLAAADRFGWRRAARLLPAALAAALLLPACSAEAGGGGATPTPLPTPVRTTYVVQRGDIVINTKIPGQVEAVTVDTAYFSMDGHVGNVYVQENELVTEGQLLADLTEIEALQSKAAEIRRAVGRAQANLGIQKALLAKYQSGGYSQFDVEIQEFQVELAEFDLSEVLTQYGLPDSGDPMADIDAQVDKARLYAPADGIIVSAVVPGRAVTKSTEAFIIGNPDVLEVVADVVQSEVDEVFQQMFEGMPVNVTLNAKPLLTLTGKVRELPSPYGSGSAVSTRVRIVLDQPPSAETYQSGDKVTVAVQLANKQGVLWLPPIAIHQVGGRTFVITDSGAGPQRVEIVIGVQTTERVEILSGLEEGQAVIGL
jgi:multidrug efflux pump subunit AcrA (membrane-fusion protein)